MPTIEETPVRLPAQIREDAFYYNAANRVVLNGNVEKEFFAVPYEGWSRQRISWIVVLVVTLMILLAMLDSFLWIVAPALGLVLGIGVQVVEKYNHNQLITGRFKRDGYVLPGEIVSAVASMSGINWGYATTQFVVDIAYQFTSPNGDLFHATIKESRPDLNGKPLPLPGTPVYVLYFNDDESYLL
jgi:lysylphosphatidylglycerol synthetase-like protein (DUF2156 family)